MCNGYSCIVYFVLSQYNTWYSLFFVTIHLFLFGHRREEFVRQMSVDANSKRHAKLIRQESIQGLEAEQNLLAPNVEGRIYILTEEVFNVTVFVHICFVKLRYYI